MTARAPSPHANEEAGFYFDTSGMDFDPEGSQDAAWIQGHQNYPIASSILASDALYDEEEDEVNTGGKRKWKPNSA